jgi:hypothetical protein
MSSPAHVHRGSVLNLSTAVVGQIACLEARRTRLRPPIKPAALILLPPSSRPTPVRTAHAPKPRPRDRFAGRSIKQILFPRPPGTSLRAHLASAMGEPIPRAETPPMSAARLSRPDPCQSSTSQSLVAPECPRRPCLVELSQRLALRLRTCTT